MKCKIIHKKKKNSLTMKNTDWNEMLEIVKIVELNNLYITHYMFYISYIFF